MSFAPYFALVRYHCFLHMHHSFWVYIGTKHYLSHYIQFTYRFLQAFYYHITPRITIARLFSVLTWFIFTERTAKRWRPFSPCGVFNNSKAGGEAIHELCPGDSRRLAGDLV
ncbi:hypothetical protein F5880DRAFT_130032 [Lentinula raphanica]|nr:hypothetical protein F5880DRAFT_130032 [Lentinula raphanica]